MLACRHLLCQSCYDGVGAKRRHCPLDKEPFQEDDVAWTTIGRESVLNRKVRCWNAEHGCDAEGVASAMLEHFTNACQFHAVRCPRCSEQVLHRGIVEHLECDCDPSRPQEQPLGDNFVNAFMEVKGTLAKILEENAALRTKMDSFEDRLRTETSGAFAAQPTSIADAVTAALERKFSELTTGAEAALAEDQREVTAEVRHALADIPRSTKKKNSEGCERNVSRLEDRVVKAVCEERTPADAGSSLSEMTGAKKEAASVEDEAKALQLLAVASLSIRSDILSKSVPYDWTIDDWNGFCTKSSDRLEYFTGNDGQPSYHYGYLVVPRLCFDDGLRVWLRVYIIEGLFDKFLKWPIEKKSCYDGVGAKRSHCPLDKEPFQEDDVAWTAIGRESVLNRKVRCWNAEHGCDNEGVASAMLEHFTNACQFHAVSCPRCSEEVLHRDIAEHLECDCVPSRRQEQPLDDNFANAFMEVKEALGKILEGNASVRRKLDSFEDRLRPEAGSTFATQSTSTADTAIVALENSIPVLRAQTEATFPEYRAVQAALNKLSEENAVLHTKLDLLEEHLDMENAMATLSTMVSDALSTAVLKTAAVCRAETEAALDKRWGEVTTEIRQTMAGNVRAVKGVIIRECQRNVLGLNASIVEALRDDRRLADAGASSSETAKKLTEIVDDEVKAMELLVVASLNSTNEFLNKSVPYEWTIEDWTEFCAKAPLSAQYFTGNDGRPSYHYEYLIVPRLCLSDSKVWLRVYMIEGLFDRFLKWPMEKKIKLLFINPCDSTRELAIESAISQELTRPLAEYRKKVVFLGRSDKIPVQKLGEHGLIGSHKLRLRLEFIP
ncbi:hypothetical protein V5799_027622 [Amblyomma americanum]|uniref:TRAF-type domain-containing protein n=1 Tax=Amblyomma americanum TaxID=6943 RepID=A0AAQ4DF72_AMBAM